MACAAMVRFCTLRNSYITVVSLARVHLQRAHRGLEVPGPARIGVELDRDGARGVDLRIGPALAAQPAHGTRCSDSDSTLMPSASQMARYIGTSA
jgi:hypothetical protein